MADIEGVKDSNLTKYLIRLENRIIKLEKEVERLDKVKQSRGYIPPMNRIIR